MPLAAPDDDGGLRCDGLRERNTGSRTTGACDLPRLECHTRQSALALAAPVALLPALAAFRNVAVALPKFEERGRAPYP